MPRILGCIKWRSAKSGLHYCEYYDTRTGKFMAIGIATNSELAEKRAAQMLPTDVVSRIPPLASILQEMH